MTYDKSYFDKDYFDGLNVEQEPTKELRSFAPVRLPEPDPRLFPIMEEGKKGGMKFCPYGVIRYLEACHVVFDGSMIRRFDGRIYSELPLLQLHDMIYQAVNSLGVGYIPTPYEINTVVKAASSLLKWSTVVFPDPEMEEPYQTTSGQLFAFENGILNTESMDLLPFTPYLYLTSYLHARYDPNIRNAPAKDVLEGIIPHGDTLDFFYEMAGYLFFNPDLNPPAIFNLYGPGNTGKSAIAHMIRTIMSGATSEIGLTQLTARFTVAELEGKLLNICGETGDTSSKITHFDGELMKRLSDGQKILVEKKGKDPYYIHNITKFLFVTNTIPDFGDNSSGLYRRLYVIPCRIKQDPSKQIYDLLVDDESRSWLVNKALAAYNHFKSTKVFAISPQMEVELTQFKSQDSVMDFLQQIFGATSVPVVAHRITEDDVLCYSVELYSAYLSFCRESLSQPLSRKKFIEKIRNEYNLKLKSVCYTGVDGKVTSRNKYVM